MVKFSQNERLLACNTSKFNSVHEKRGGFNVRRFSFRLIRHESRDTNVMSRDCGPLSALWFRLLCTKYTWLHFDINQIAYLFAIHWSRTLYQFNLDRSAINARGRESATSWWRHDTWLDQTSASLTPPFRL